MRDLLIIIIFLAVGAMALKRPWIGVMLWTWISLMNPHRYAYGFSYFMPIAMLSVLVTLIGFFNTNDRQSPFKGAPVVILLFLFIWITISWKLGIDPSLDYALWDKVMKIYFMIFITLALLNNRYQILAFVWVCAFSLALLGAKGGLFTIMTGGDHRVWGPPGSFIGGNNEFALALIMIVPLLYFLKLQTKSKWLGYGLLFTMLLCTAAALGSQSRGALVALIAMGSMFWWRSPKKGQIGILILVVGLAMIPMMPESWFDRMQTIETYEEDASAMGRINAWVVGFEVAKHRFFGAGMGYLYPELFAAYAPYDNNPVVAHSIYFQMLGNHGFVGLGLFLLLYFFTYRTAGWLRKEGAKIPEAKWTADLGAMVQVGLVGYATGGAFLSLNYFDLPLSMMVMVVVARKWVETKGWETDPKMTFLEYVGFKRKDGKPVQRTSGKAMRQNRQPPPRR